MKETINQIDSSYKLPINYLNLNANNNQLNIKNNLSKEEFRQKINDLYNQTGMIIPIDNSINNVIYSKKDLEKGLSINTNILALRQMWIEYRLFYNEMKNKEQNISTKNERMYQNMEEKESYVLSNFDDIFQDLNKKVDGVNGIVSQLNDMKQKVNSSNLILDANKKSFNLYMQEERTKLEKEKEEFELLKKAQETKLKEEKNKITQYYKKIQELVEKINSQMDKLNNI